MTQNPITNIIYSKTWNLILEINVQKVLSAYWDLCEFLIKCQQLK